MACSSRIPCRARGSFSQTLPARARWYQADLSSSSPAAHDWPALHSHPPARYRSYPKVTSSPADGSTPTTVPKPPASAGADHSHRRARREPVAAACPLNARPKAAPSQTPRDPAQRQPRAPPFPPDSVHRHSCTESGRSPSHMRQASSENPPRCRDTKNRPGECVPPPFDARPSPRCPTPPRAPTVQAR